MSSEYIFEINDALYDHETGKVCMMPKIVGKLIRCKDCKYMTEHYDTDGNVPYWTCSEWDSGTDYDGFCHLAERRSDGTD